MIIGISGKAQSGKDTFAEMLIKELNKESIPPYIMMAFANELKNKCQKDFDLTYEQLWGNDKEVSDKRYQKEIITYSDCSDDNYKIIYWTAREIMQEYGAFFRKFDQRFWIKNLFKIIEEKEYSNVIITDVRYINEADYILDRGGYVVRIDRESKNNVHNMEHPSEVELDNYNKFTFKVLNNWTLDVLEKTAVETAQLLKEIKF